MDLSCEGMGDEYASVFAHSLRLHPNVRTLNLKDNRLTSKGLAVIFAALRDARARVAVLDVSNNRLDLASLGTLCPTLKSVACAVVDLVLVGRFLVHKIAVVVL
jgi:hypothetical protein